MGLYGFKNACRQKGFRGAYLYGYYVFLKLNTFIAGPGRECPVCGWKGHEFAPFFNVADGVVRQRVLCPKCGSFERHRAYKLFYDDFFKQPGMLRGRMMHFAPERCLEPVLKSFSQEYLKSNYPAASAGEQCLDLRTLGPLANASFDVLVMNNVLSCMPGDLEAINSMYRVLKERGVVLAGDYIVPDKSTAENTAVGYGGSHRVYGMHDLAERFKPFDVKIIDVTEKMTKEKISRYGLLSPQYMIILRKK